MVRLRQRRIRFVVSLAVGLLTVSWIVTLPTISSVSKNVFFNPYDDNEASQLQETKISKEKLKVWPEEDDSDRIDAQLKYIPENIDNITKNGTKLKNILIYSYTWDTLYLDNTYEGRRTFVEDKCLVNTCNITFNNKDFNKSDVVLWTIFTLAEATKVARPSPNQIWAMYILEPPHLTGNFDKAVKFNLTATYRWDSDIPVTYGDFHLFNPNAITLPQTINYAANKTKKVAWFVRNCQAINQRLEYAIELNKSIDVDIYGQCIPNNKYQCPREQKEKCYKMLDTDYKFYLAFENSNCIHYITEKSFVNSLQRNIIPIVMGARKEDYVKALPYNSFIYVEDFETPKDLADYLHKLDTNDTLYNEYFQWKGTGEFRPMREHFWCRFCAMIHDNRRKVYDMTKWWRGPGVCRKNAWRPSGTLL